MGKNSLRSKSFIYGNLAWDRGGISNMKVFLKGRFKYLSKLDILITGWRKPLENCSKENYHKCKKSKQNDTHCFIVYKSKILK